MAALSEAGQAQALLAEALERIATRRVTTMDSAVSLAGESVRTLSTRLEALKNLQGQGLESQEAVNRAALDLMQAELVSKEREDARAAQHQSILARLKSALVVSPCDGVVLEVTAREGGFADPLQPALTIPATDRGSGSAGRARPAAAALDSTGETVFISGRSGDPRSSDARIAQIADNGQVTVSLPRGSPFRAGDAVECSVQKLTQSYPLLVPNAAVGLDSQGSFIWVLQQRGGPLGDEYYVVQAHVTVVDSDDSMTAISSGLQPDEKVVGRSSKPLAGAGQPGDARMRRSTIGPRRFSIAELLALLLLLGGMLGGSAVDRKATGPWHRGMGPDQRSGQGCPRSRQPPGDVRP